MTTTEPITEETVDVPAWLEDLVPADVREEGAKLLEELEAAVARLAPLLGRIGKHMAWSQYQEGKATEAFEQLFGPSDASDGLWKLMSAASRTQELHDRLEDLGFDPDELARRHAPILIGEEVQV